MSKFISVIKAGVDASSDSTGLLQSFDNMTSTPFAILGIHSQLNKGIEEHLWFKL